MNITKTKVIRIGNIRETDRRFCRENDLDWVYEFTALGIDYNMRSLENITEQNILPKIEKMEGTLKSWGFRNITPLGRVTILKSLVLSKITHILQALPTPPKQLLTTIEHLCFEFIWGKKRHEVKKETAYKDTKDGGLKMMNIVEFDHSLKLTWLRKILTTEPDWIEFPKKYKIDRLMFTDSKIHTTILCTIKNKFWKSVALAYVSWYKALKKSTKIPIEYTPIWGNALFNVPFNSTMFNNNMIFLPDFFNEDGTMISQKNLEDRIGVKIPFTQYFGLRKAIPKEWREFMRHYQKTQNMERPTIIDWLTKDKKGGQNLRKVWHIEDKESTNIGQIRWNEELGEIDNATWSSLYQMADRCKINVRSKYFQFQILHRSIMTNRKLYQFNLRDNEECDQCGEIETISHLLYNCNYIKQIWNSTINWLSPLIREDIQYDKNSILLGNTRNTILVNYIFIVLKHEIYKFKWKKIQYRLIFLKRSLKNYMNIELYNAKIIGKEEKTLGKWSPLLNNLRNIQ